MRRDPPSLHIEPLDAHHERTAFSCGSAELDRYLRQQAGQDARRHVAATFVLVESGHPAVIGYYTLAATSVGLRELPEPVARRLPKYPRVPAILLGRLAVDRNSGGKGYGELLLIDAMKRCLETREIGWTALIVDAKNDRALGFYEHYHFMRFSPSSNRLFLPRATMAALLGIHVKGKAG